MYREAFLLILCSYLYNNLPVYNSQPDHYYFMYNSEMDSLNYLPLRSRLGSFHHKILSSFAPYLNAYKADYFLYNNHRLFITFRKEQQQSTVAHCNLQPE